MNLDAHEYEWIVIHMGKGQLRYAQKSRGCGAFELK